VLELVDGSGTVIALSDDIAWNGNNFGDPPNALDRDTGSFLVNVTVDPGEYFLRVSIATEDFVSFPGVVEFADIPPFINLLIDMEFQAEGDCDCNGAVEFADIPVFIGILIGAAP